MAGTRGPQDSGAWTRRVLPDVIRWKNRKHREVTYHLTQALSGHRTFNQFLKKIRRRDSAACKYCGYATDDVEHSIFHCKRWDTERKEYGIPPEEELLAPGNLEIYLLSSKNNWKAFSAFAKVTLSRKEQEDSGLGY
ncbi:uncharacterized protein LOC143266213 [Megachile rotundata]|uniref:uncharacterized protein LOC143266213 n=1 Tax=Megachile rotundata TaxID=143995 RepID=UPI003FD502AD